MIIIPRTLDPNEAEEFKKYVIKIHEAACKVCGDPELLINIINFYLGSLISTLPNSSLSEKHELAANLHYTLIERLDDRQ